MIKLLSLLLVSFMLLPAGYGQNKKDRKIVTALDELIGARYQAIAPGCVVLVAKKGHIMYERAFGMADLERRIPMQTNMVFRIGSITKQFTAVGVLQLVEQGKTALQDSIQQYVPDYPHKGYTITIENLLTQTSGIKDYMAIDKPAGETLNYTPGQGVDYFKGEPLEFKPGSEFKYSNSNYYLLGYILERITGETYAKYLHDHIFSKIGLEHTYYIDPTKPVSDTPQGYSRFDGKLEKAELQNVTALYAAGGIMSTAEDLYRWHQALYRHELISDRLLDKAHTPFRFPDGTYSEYGYGWYIRNLDGSKTVEHSGSTDGFQADEIFLPAEDVYVVALFNCFQANMDWTMLSNDIARVAIGKPLDDYLHLKESVLHQYVGEYDYTPDHKLIITLEDGKLFVQDPNPNDRLPKVQLYASTETMFFIKEADLRFEFVKDEKTGSFKIVTYNNRGKDAEWEKTK